MRKLNSAIKVNRVIFALILLVLWALSIVLVPSIAKAQDAGVYRPYGSTQMNSNVTNSYSVYNSNNASTNTNGSNYNSTNYTSAPVINYISPTTLDAQSSNTITIFGANFTSNSYARVNNSNRTTTYLDQGRLVMQLNSGDLQTGGNFTITVYNSGSGMVSNGVNLYVRSYNSAANTSTSGSAVSYRPSGYSQTAAVGNAGVTTNYVTDPNQSASSNGEITPESNYGAQLTSNALSGSPGGFLPSGLIQWLIVAIVILLVVIMLRKLYSGEHQYMETPLKHA